MKEDTEGAVETTAEIPASDAHGVPSLGKFRIQEPEHAYRVAHTTLGVSRDLALSHVSQTFEKSVRTRPRTGPGHHFAVSEHGDA